MTNNLRLLRAVLNLFEGGAAAPAGAPGESSAPDAGEQTGEPEVQQQSDAGSAEDRTKAYNDFIEQNKDLDGARIQKIVTGRLKSANSQIQQLQQQLDAAQPIIDRMTAKYNVSDLSQIAQAIDNDTAMWEAEADAAGLTVEQFMDMQNLRRENQRNLRQLELNEMRAREQQKKDAIVQQSISLKQQYPDFDLQAELNNDEFRHLVWEKGIPVDHAYKLIHMDELMNQATQAAAAKTEKAITDNIRATGMRPAENGTLGQSAFAMTTDVNNLTPKDMDELIRRARNGEIITLKQN